MPTKPTAGVLERQPASTRVKLAAAWTSVMFLYAYVDILNFFKPGVVESILAGKVFVFDVSPTLLTIFLALQAIPTFMVVLSMTLPAPANRITNLIVASVQIPYAAFNMAGASESWTYFYGLGVVLEVILLALILRYAWTWPRTPRANSDVEAGQPLHTARTA